MLRQKTLSALFWSFFERFGQRVIQVVISIILARLLSPAEFGLIGMVTIFMLLAQSVVDSGFGQALIQRQNITVEDESSVFWLNILLGIIMTGVLYLCAPWIAVFYNEPLLVPLIRVLSFNLFINSFGVVQQNLLIKHLQFDVRTKATLAAIFISGCIGVFMAWWGFGVWSLVGQSLSQNVLFVLFVWVISSWRPVFVVRIQSLRLLFSFGSKMLFAGLLNTIFENIYVVIIGKIYTPADLGYYSQAQQFTRASSQTLSQVVSQVNFPVLAELQHDTEAMRKIFRKILVSTILIIFPVMTGAAVMAPLLIQLLLGERWLPSASYFRILCIIGMLYPLHLLNLDIIRALGRSDLFFNLEIIKKGFVLIAILVTGYMGIEAMLWGQVIVNLLAYGINAFYTDKFLGYSWFRQLIDLLGIIFICGVMAVGIYWVGNVPLWALFPRLLLQTIVGGVSFTLMFAMIMKVRPNSILGILGTQTAISIRQACLSKIL